MTIDLNDFTRVNSDTNGNPRYVIHYLNCMPNIEDWNDQYGETVRLMNKIGGRKYHNKSYGGGIVFQSYNLEYTIKSIKEAMKEAEKMHNNLKPSRRYFKYERLLLDSAGYDDATYLNTLENDKQRAEFIKGRLYSEYKYCIDRKGEHAAITDWLQGLALNIPYMNVDIIKLAGICDATESKQQNYINKYWSFMAMRLLQLFKHFDI